MTEIWVRDIRGWLQKVMKLAKIMIKEKELEYGMKMGYWCELWRVHCKKK